MNLSTKQKEVIKLMQKGETIIDTGIATWLTGLKFIRIKWWTKFILKRKKLIRPESYDFLPGIIYYTLTPKGREIEI